MVDIRAADHGPAAVAAISPIRQIPAEQTYDLGYLIERELRERLQRDPQDQDAIEQEENRRGVVETGKHNQEAYLASDHLDVYVATSMRRRHEFLAVNRLGKAILSHADLAELKLRWFDLSSRLSNRC